MTSEQTSFFFQKRPNFPGPMPRKAMLMVLFIMVALVGHKST